MPKASRLLPVLLLGFGLTLIIGASIARAKQPPFGEVGQAGGTGQSGGAGQAGGTGQSGGAGQAGGTGKSGGAGQAGEAGQAPPPVQGGTTPPAGNEANAKGKGSSNEEKPLRRFGDDFFAASRASIIAARQKAASGQSDSSAFVGPSGPTSLGNVYGTPPETYQLGPGDKLTVRVTTPYRDPVEAKVVVDTFGSIVVPATGRKLTVRGQTMTQAESLLTAEVTKFLKEPTVTIVLDELRTFSVSVLGESYAPGVYQVPATFSLFNLILATGGPAERGTLRSIQLRRNNAPAKTFDLYAFLISGNAKQDVQLQPGDVVFYGVSQGEASIEGEVNRPGTFELAGKESLSTLLSYAGGIRPSGVAQNISIDSVVPGSERRLLNINLDKMSPASDPPVRDGDKVSIFSIRALVRNAVTISGPVEQPRTYAFREGMTVRDLVQLALGLRPEADKSIAEVRRLQADGTFSLTRLNLAEALKGDPKANLTLMPDDTLRVFDVNDLNWTGERKVTISGAVRSPGEKYRADGMKVGDLIREGRGLELDAYSQEAHLQRFNKDGTPDILLKVNLIKAALGDPEHDILLQDRDQLKVYKIAEWSAFPDLTAAVQGAVQRPGNYPLATNLRVRDLIELAGGLALDAYSQEAHLQRFSKDGTPDVLVKVNLVKASQGDPASNITIQSRDQLRVYRLAEWSAIPELIATVQGSVQRPGNFPLAKGLRVKDLIEQAGGLTLDAYSEKAFLQKINVDGTIGPIVVINVKKALEGDLNHNVEIGSRDRLNVQSLSQARFQLDQTVTIKGGVQRPGTYPASSNLTLKDLIDLAGGLLPDASGAVEVASAWKPLGEGLSTVQMQGQMGAWIAPNFEVVPGNVVSVFQRSDVLARPRIVTVLGAVAQPGAYVLTREGERISDVVKRAGGLQSESFPRASEFIRDPKFLVTGQQKNVTPKILEALQKVSQDEYKRATALLDLDRLKLVFSNGSSVVGGTVSVPITPPASEQPSQLGSEIDRAMAKILSSEGVTAARALNEKDVLPAGNLNARVDRAISRPKGKDDLELMDGDVIIIPLKPRTVNVTGAVMSPASIIFEPGASLDYYLMRAGGVTRDSDKETILVIRATGELVRYKRGVRMELGDTILVPTKVQATRLKNDTPEIQTAVNGLTSAAMTLAILRAIR